jgi:acetyl esterase/lipase
VSRRHFLKLAGGGAAATLAACSPLAILNGVASSSTYTVRRGLPYGDHPRQRFDVYLPATTPAHAALRTPGAPGTPVIVFFYGGNWDSGDRGDYLFEALASRGCITVIPDYRLYPEVRYAGFLADSAQAVRAVIAQAPGWGGDLRHLHLSGHSAGGYNAAMLALNPAYLQAAGVAPSSIHGLIGLAGPYDFLPLQSDVTKAIFGYPDTPLTTQPIYYASAAAPPALLLTGDKDDVVDPGNSTRLAHRLRTFGVPVRTVVYPGLGHRALIGALSRPLRGLAPVLDDIAAFVHPA